MLDLKPVVNPTPVKESKPKLELAMFSNLVVIGQGHFGVVYRGQFSGSHPDLLP
jgi:hypothetical protein